MKLNHVKYDRKEYRNGYLKSQEWINLRDCILRPEPMCQCCQKTKATEVHHMAYRNIVDILATDLLPVCRKCHTFIHEAIKDGYISQREDKIKKITEKTLGILEDEKYKAWRKWLREKHFLSEEEIAEIKKAAGSFIIKRIAGMIKSKIWYEGLEERKFTGRQILKIRSLIDLSIYRTKNRNNKRGKHKLFKSLPVPRGWEQRKPLF